jgi:UDP-N-acetylmuramate dehydrogenase
MADLRHDLLESIRGEVFENAPLQLKTTYQIGGPARFLVCPRDLDDLCRLNEVINRHAVRKFVLGGGANVLISDNGFDGVIIHLNHFNRLVIEGSLVTAEAGLILDELVVACLRASLAGMEPLSGIPGTLGGALRMNAGAFDAEISDFLQTVECLDFQGRHWVLSKEEVDFHYRAASKIRDSFILGANFEFPSSDPETLLKARQEILARRYQRQPWQYPSAGSVFKRPPGHYAGKLIEDAGLKGHAIGRAQISSKHAGIIINLGGAKATDVASLIRLAQNRVRERFRVDLELEQELVGFER